MATPEDERSGAPEPGCPLCGKPRDSRYKPFCSKRCADVDLNRWLSGAYAVPVAEDDEPEPPPRDEKRPH